MQTFPLPSISLENAMQMQFRLVDAITRHFNGSALLTQGDLGVVPGLGAPSTTRQAETVIADFFDAPACVLTRGAGIGAIRFALMSTVPSGGRLLVHRAPIYETTKITLESMGITPVEVDYHDPEAIAQALQSDLPLHGALVQLTRQKPDDCYDYAAVISQIKTVCPTLPVITDDNYAVCKVAQIGVQCGADLSCFSSFKLLGPEGIGVVIGQSELIARIRTFQYSGGSQVQGHEAMDVLRGLVYAPVALAIQARVNEELLARLRNGEIPQVKNAFLANAQSKVLLVEFDSEIAEPLLEIAPRYGAVPYPVGAESKYEIAPMFYRISGTFRRYDPALEKRMIRINPMRSGADTVLRILQQSIAELERGRTI